MIQTLFSDFEIWRLAISRPVKVGKSYIPEKKALLPGPVERFWSHRDFTLDCSFETTGTLILKAFENYQILKNHRD